MTLNATFWSQILRKIDSFLRAYLIIHPWLEADEDQRVCLLFSFFLCRLNYVYWWCNSSRSARRAFSLPAAFKGSRMGSALRFSAADLGDETLLWAEMCLKRQQRLNLSLFLSDAHRCVCVCGCICLCVSANRAPRGGGRNIFVLVP